MLNEEDFCSSFVHEYLRYIQRDKSTLTGVFEYDSSTPIVWGAVVEYGVPPQNGLIIEIWSTENAKNETASFRFWHGKENRHGKTLKGRVIDRDELTTKAVAHAG